MKNRTSSKPASPASEEVRPFTSDGTYHTDYDIIIHLPFYREASDLHVKWIKQIETKAPLVIEAGGGTGNMTAAAVRARPDADIHLLDLNEAMTRFAPAKGIAPSKIHLSDVTNMALSGVAISDSSVDHVYSHSVLWGLPDPNLFFRESFRVLKSGGTLAISTNGNFDEISREGFINYLVFHLDLAVQGGQITSTQAANFVDNNRIITQAIKHRFSKEDLVRIGKDFGFETVESHPAYVVDTPRGKEAFFWQMLYRKE